MMRYAIGAGIALVGLTLVAIGIAVAEAHRIVHRPDVVDYEAQRGLAELERIANGE